MDTDNFYRTKDLSLASFLYASNKKLLEFYKENAIVYFIFEDKRSCEELVSSFWQKTAMINVKEFVDASKTMKDLIFNAERAVKPVKDLMSAVETSIQSIKDLDKKVNSNVFQSGAKQEVKEHGHKSN